MTINHNRYLKNLNCRFLLWLLLALFLAFIDLYSKKLIFEIIDQHNPITREIYITSFFNLVKVWNRGISFGMMNDLENGKYIISIINSLIMVVVLLLLYKAKNNYLSLAFSLIIGGAIGNLVDRFINDAVADFLDFHLFGYHWPAFNLADSLVFIGVAMILLENFFIKNEKD